MIGQHLLADLYEIDAERLADAGLLDDCLREAARLGGLSPLGPPVLHRFEGGGLTGFLLQILGPIPTVLVTFAPQLLLAVAVTLNPHVRATLPIQKAGLWAVPSRYARGACADLHAAPRAPAVHGRDHGPPRAPAIYGGLPPGATCRGVRWTPARSPTDVVSLRDQHIIRKLQIRCGDRVYHGIA